MDEEIPQCKCPPGGKTYVNDDDMTICASCGGWVEPGMQDQINTKSENFVNPLQEIFSLSSMSDGFENDFEDDFEDDVEDEDEEIEDEDT